MAIIAAPYNKIRFIPKFLIQNMLHVRFWFLIFPGNLLRTTKWIYNEILGEFILGNIY